MHSLSHNPHDKLAHGFAHRYTGVSIFAMVIYLYTVNNIIVQQGILISHTSDWYNFRRSTTHHPPLAPPTTNGINLILSGHYTYTICNNGGTWCVVLNGLLQKAALWPMALWLYGLRFLLSLLLL